MNLIHLTSQQTRCKSFDHPLLEYSTDVNAEVLDKLVEFYIKTRSKQAYDDLILGNLILVKWVVGRYLHHWPESRPYADDMASEGIMAVTEIVAGLDETIKSSELRAVMVVRIKRAIEFYLNDNRSIVRAGLSTNFSRLKAGQELEYANSVSLDEKLVDGQLDESFAAIDVLDSLDALDCIDKEEFVDLVLLMLERHPQILESEAPERVKNLIERIIQAIKA